MTAGKNKGITKLRCNLIYGNIIYYDFIPERILFDGGYVTFVNNQPSYHFYLADHQGNVRIVASVNGTVEETNHYYPYGALFGESVSGSRQRYKYNGKELDRMNDLDWYDYGARFYDASIGRWGTMDPLAEKYYDISPYAYCLDNPANVIDPDGKKVWIFATRLPSEKWGGVISSATLTFVVVQTSDGKMHRLEYGPLGDPVSGISTLRQLYYDKSGDAVDNYMKGKQDDNIKNVIEVNVPTGMTMDEFDKK